MIFIPQTITLKNLTPEFFFAECERQYVFERAIEKKLTSKEYYENKLNNSSERKHEALVKEIRNLEQKITWVAFCDEYKCWKIQHKYSLVGDLSEITKNISFVFKKIQENLIIKKRNLKNDDCGENVLSHINHNWDIGYGIKIKDIKGSTTKDKLINITDEKKLKSQIKRIQKQRSELSKLHSGLIGAGQAYEICSDEVVRNREADEQKQYEYILSKYVVYADHRKIPLSKVVSTEKQRFAEIYIQVTSLDAYAKQLDYKPLFITFTAPARFHPKPSNGVSSWDGSTPKESNDYLKGLWNAFRKDIHRYKIEMNGFWAVEPHKDQCFHKHALMYVNKKHYDELAILINKHFRHSENAVRIEEIDTKKSKATSYVMKYLTKSFNMDFELKDGVLNIDKLEISNHKKVRAVQALWGVRRYAMFGVNNTLSLWRELKRKPFFKGKNETLDKAFMFVEKNDFIGFSMFVNGKLKIMRVFNEIQIMKDDLLGNVFSKSLIGKYIIDLGANEVIDIKSTCKIVDASSFDAAAA
ncbi:TPA: replication endonuclease [Pseudomonas aeruginosa]|uniref:replication endonuclease n=1 Tax=Pseudomonas sp. LP_4_YM TaxID=2485135 RepID=UPI001047F3C4|nr:replication endonuclease [Pseudomonas sp. LP_4_YM]TCT97614.1 bacteriophage replication gene A protein [Pseudomonas sp. LP_4_YM]HCE6885758.1 replication endonuclease [Pseudomonas aeruginosa]